MSHQATDATHWNGVYTARAPENLGWFQATPTASATLLDQLALRPGAPIIDVGGGASAFVDLLLARELGPVTVLDLSWQALEHSRRRLGERAGVVDWRTGDVRDAPFLAAHFSLWHDRAAYHFLTAPESRAQYLRQAASSVRSGGHLIIGCFAPSGPERCSGLPVRRADAQTLADDFAAGFTLLRTVNETHRTPGGQAQDYTFVLLRRTPTPLPGDWP